MKKFLKIYFCFFYFALIWGSFPSPKTIHQLEWKLYKAKFNKTYSSTKSERQAFENYLYNLKEIIEANHKIPKENHKTPVYFGLNDFSDMSYENFIKGHTGYRPSKRENIKKFERKTRKNSKLQINSEALKIKEIDWNRTLNMLPPRSQGDCGCCWAFSAAAALEAYYVITTGGAYQYFSVQQIMDCCIFNDCGCSGGDMFSGFYTATRYRINYDHYYPYVEKKTTCHPNITSFRSAFRIHSFKWTRPLDELGVLFALQKQPLSVAVHASRAWVMYQGGILPKDQCSEDSNDLNHAVVLVGFTEEYWLVRNSWGTNWGENGHIRLERGNTCGILYDVVWPSMDEFDEDFEEVEEEE